MLDGNSHFLFFFLGNLFDSCKGGRLGLPVCFALL